MRSPLARFVLGTLAWMPLAFAVWYLAAPILLWPVERLVWLVGRTAFGDLVRDVAMDGATISIGTSLRPGQSLAGAQVAVDVNALLYAFGLPLFAALVLAARECHWLRHLAVGYVVMLPFITWGVVADFLKNVAIASGPLIASQTGFSAAQREVIAFAYQFGALILPSVVPAVLWVLLHRRFLEALREAGRTSGA